MSEETPKAPSEQEQVAEKLFNLGVARANEIIHDYVQIEDKQTRANTRYLVFQTAVHLLANQCFVASLDKDTRILNRNLLAAKINDVSDEIYEHVELLNKAMIAGNNEKA